MTPLILSVIFICSLIQSLFGVGLLLFGTPALITLADLSFEAAVSLLIPCSLVVNLGQLSRDWPKPGSHNLFLVIVTGPALASALVVQHIFQTSWHVWQKHLMAGVMLWGALMRLWNPSRQMCEKLARKQTLLWLVLMGIIHGLTNLGGACLTLYAVAHERDKKKVLQLVATGYFVMCSIQGLVMISLGSWQWLEGFYWAPFLAGGTWFFLGRHQFENTSETIYDRLITVFMLVFAFMLAGKALS